MKKINMIPYRYEKNLSINEKLEYYKKLRDYCYELSETKKQEMSKGQRLISRFYMNNFYKEKLQIIGEENIPLDKPIIFVCNHSNSHDIFSMYIALEKLGIATSVMVATDCLNIFSTMLFAKADATLLDRRDKISSNNSIFELASKIIAGKTGVIFGEATWNLHPIKPMHDIKLGASKIACLTDAVIIPTILEYIEIPELFDKESHLYDKVIVEFGVPQKITLNQDLSLQTLCLQKNMENMRRKIWTDNGVIRNNLYDIDINNYLNHTYLKKYGVFGFKYDSESEAKFLRSGNGEPTENEFFMNEDNQFIPGITLKKSKR